MSSDVMTVIVATVAMFAVGGAWYMGLFAKQWGEMFDFDKLSKKEQKAMQAKMGPFYAIQVLVTVFSAFSLAKLHTLLPDYSVYTLAFLLWFGFVLPAQVSAVIFGGVEPKWIPRRITLMAGEALAHLLFASWIIQLMEK